MQKDKKIQQLHKLHNRRLAKIDDELSNANCPKLYFYAIKRHLSQYTSDIENQVILSNLLNNDKSSK